MKNECETIQAQLFELRDGSLDSIAKELAESHLATCASCRAAFAWDARLTDSMRADSLPEPSVGLAASVQHRVSVRRQRLWLTALGSAASAAVIASLVAWQPWMEQQSIVDSRGYSSPNHQPVDDFPELARLFEPPPVDSLDVLSRQQNSYMTAMHRLGKE